MYGLLLVPILFLSLVAEAVEVPGYFDINGNLMHTQDEFDLQVAAQAQGSPAGYRYIYSLKSLPSSIQPIKSFSLQISSDAVVGNSSTSPWMMKREPQVADKHPKMAWVTLRTSGNPELLQPGMQVSGFSFISPYPPGMAIGYATGVNGIPRFDPNYPDTPAGRAGYDDLPPYGPGKVFPVIGPVPPKYPNGGGWYQLLQCTGGLCDVQLDITGPMDVDGTKYVYQWSGPFGAAFGAQPVVQLPAGTHQVSVSVSDAQGTLLATATLPVTVVDPNPPGDSDDGSPDDNDHGDDDDKDHKEDHGGDDHHDNHD